MKEERVKMRRRKENEKKMEMMMERKKGWMPGLSGTNSGSIQAYLGRGYYRVIYRSM